MISFLSLGFSPLQGKASVDQCVTLKKQLRSVLDPVDGAWLIVVPDEGRQRCEVRVAFDKSFPGASEWAKKAQELAPEIWGTLVERRREVEVG